MGYDFNLNADDWERFNKKKSLLKLTEVQKRKII